MRLTRRRIAIVALAAGVALGGCGGESTSSSATPEPQGNTDDRPLVPVTPTEESGEPTPTPTPRAEDAPTYALQDPCALITSSDRRELRLEPGRRHDITSARSCEWRRSAHYSFGVAIWDRLGIKDLVSKTKIRDLTIGSHAARQGTGGVAACAFAIEVGPTSRVDVSSSANGDIERACAVARRGAALVERHLP